MLFYLTCVYDVKVSILISGSHHLTFSWSPKGNYLLSTAKDWTVIYWSLADLDHPYYIRDHQPFSYAEFVPGSDNTCVVLPLYGMPRLYTIDYEQRSHTMVEFALIEFDAPR